MKHPVPARVEKKLKRMRTLFVALAGVVVVCIVGYGVYYSLQSPGPDEITEGTHYRLVEDLPRPDPAGPIRVIEFFSYGCVHCMNFDPLVTEWDADLPDDVRFERIPVAFSPEWTLLSQTYFVLARSNALEGNHDRLFDAIHDGNRTFATKEALADFVDGHGIDRAAFLEAFDSADTRRALGEAARKVRDYEVTGVPTVAVNRYVVSSTLPRRDVLPIADKLIERSRAERADITPAADTTPGAGAGTP